MKERVDNCQLTKAAYEWIFLLCITQSVCLHVDVQAELDSVEAELELVELQIAELLEKQAQLTRRKNALLKKVEETCNAAQPSSSLSSPSSSPKVSGGPVMTKQELQHYDGTGTALASTTFNNFPIVYSTKTLSVLSLLQVVVIIQKKSIALVIQRTQA